MPLLVVAASALAMAQSAGAATWKVQAVPKRMAPNGDLTSVSCPSLTGCEAAGYSLNTTGQQQALAEVWNGTNWATQTAAKPAGAKASLLEGLSWPLTTACTAVGASSTSSAGFPVSPLAESWNGSSWSLETVRDSQQRILSHEHARRVVGRH
jgi:hypothetical protein